MVIATIALIPRKVEAKDDLCAVIETVIVLKEKFKAEQIVDILLGKSTADIKSYGHDALEEFGSLDGTDPRYLNAVIRQAEISG